MADTTRWTVNVAAATDINVRTYLAQRGIKKGDLSRFIEDAVKWRLLDLTVAEARAKFEMPTTPRGSSCNRLLDQGHEGMRRLAIKRAVLPKGATRARGTIRG